MELELPGDSKFETGAEKRMNHSILLRQMLMPSAKRNEVNEAKQMMLVPLPKTVRKLERVPIQAN